VGQCKSVNGMQRERTSWAKKEDGTLGMCNKCIKLKLLLKNIREDKKTGRKRQFFKCWGILCKGIKVFRKDHAQVTG